MPRRGLDRVVAGLPALSLLFCPYPPSPPSRREGGESLFSYARGFAPCIPGAGREAALEVGREVVFDRGACPRNRARAPGYGSNNSFGKVLGGSGDSFKSPPAYLRRHTRAQEKGWSRARAPGYGNNNSFRKVLGGSGDSFKSPPAYLRISPYPPPAPCKKEGTAHEGRFRGMITRRSDRSARCPAPGSSGRRHTG